MDTLQEGSFSPSFRTSFAPIDPPWYRSPSLYVGGILPSLNLDFANDRYAVNQAPVSINDIITATLPIGRYVDKNGIIRTSSSGDLRYDYSTGERNLVLELIDRTNLHPDSEDLSTWASQANTARTLESVIAPDGTTGVYSLARTSTSAAYRHRGDIPKGSVDAEKVTAMILAKKKDARYAAVRFQNNYPNYVDFVFDFNTGTIIETSNHGSITDGTSYVRKIGDYYLFIISMTTLGSSGNLQFLISCNNDGGDLDDTDSSNSVAAYFWGAMVLVGGEAMYIPTSGGSALRSKDVFSITGTNFSNFFGGTEFTTKIDGLSPYSNNVPVLIDFKDNTVSDRIYAALAPSSKLVDVVAKTGGSFDFSGAETYYYKDNHAFSLAFGGNATKRKGSVNGGKVYEDTTFTNAIGDFTKMKIGDGTGTYDPNLLFLSRILVFNNYLSDDNYKLLSYNEADFLTDGDSYMNGANGIGIALSILQNTTNTIGNTAVGGSTLEEATARVEANVITGLKPLIFCDGSVNDHGTTEQDIAKYDRMVTATNDNYVFISPVVYPDLVGGADETYTDALTAAMLTAYPGRVVDGTAIAEGLAGTSDRTDAAYTALFQADGVHPEQTLSDALAQAAIDLL